MNIVEKIYKEVTTMSESDAREVLDFVGYLKAKRSAKQTDAGDLSEFDKFGAVFAGKFNRDECYDRKVLR